ncbi:MAG: YbeD family protein [Pseudomonadales bacterium]|jgi:putative lipoic acid-binding regulatory protein
MEKPPIIEFPCAYPIKVIGAASIEFRQTVIGVLKAFDSRLKDEDIVFQASAKGNYESIKVTLWALSEKMLAELFGALKTIPGLKMVL